MKHPAADNSVLTDVLTAERAAIIERAVAVLSESHARHYDAAGRQLRQGRLEALYDKIVLTLERRDIGSALAFARTLAQERFASGYDLSEVQIAVNALEEAVWRAMFTRLAPPELEDGLGRVSTVFGAVKDVLAREYVALAARAHSPSLDLPRLIGGSGSGMSLFS